MAGCKWLPLCRLAQPAATSPPISSVHRHHRQTLSAAGAARSPAGNLERIAMRSLAVHYVPPSERLLIMPLAVVPYFERVRTRAPVRRALLGFRDVNGAPSPAGPVLVHPPPRPPRSEPQLAHLGRCADARDDTSGRELLPLEPV